MSPRESRLTPGREAQALMDCWKDFQQMVLPLDAPQEQIDFAFQCFLGGAVTTAQYYVALREHFPSNVPGSMQALFEAIHAQLIATTKEAGHG